MSHADPKSKHRTETHHKHVSSSTLRYGRLFLLMEWNLKNAQISLSSAKMKILVSINNSLDMQKLLIRNETINY